MSCGNFLPELHFCLVSEKGCFCRKEFCFCFGLTSLGSGVASFFTEQIRCILLKMVSAFLL
ncbi:hypothetical protein JCM6292_2905 [Bacteroides pyogenes JCM 6292]|uniref:Uncharacterized protein n=1 Tax=Bacteroides pyogenes JCM 6292 TaxID=1235809 RepID=W4P9R9_9BACE|nr:hypothetical protein JCM6292_2905 [Bacteroides pyogenes JCM 6292]